MGQANPVFVFAYTCVNTIEERVAAILAQKRELFDEVVDSTSLDLRANLSLDDLLGLFELARP